MLTRTLSIAAIAAAVFTVAIPPAAYAQDWTQWRGPHRDGQSTAAAPATYATTPTQVWKVTVGTGHASPLVANGRVYLLSRQGNDEVVSAFDLQSGKTIWAQRYPAPYTVNSAAASHGQGPKSTPLLHAGKIYTLGISGIFSCFDAATGAVKWRKEFAKEFKATSPDYGTAMSPIADGGLVIAHVGGPNSGALRAFDAETGATKWSWTEDGPGYASPIVVDIAGTRQLVAETQKYLAGIALATGQTLWRQPFTTAWDQNSVTPIVWRDTIIISGEDKPTTALRIAKQGTSWSVTKVWENANVPMYMSSPVLDGDTLIGLSHKNKGQFFALDARTGTTRWTSPGRQGDNAALVLAGHALFMLTTDANLIVTDAAGASYSPIKTYSVASSPTWAHPVVLGNRVLIKDEQTLALLTIGTPGTSPKPAAGKPAAGGSAAQKPTALTINRAAVAAAGAQQLRSGPSGPVRSASIAFRRGASCITLPACAE